METEFEKYPSQTNEKTTSFKEFSLEEYYFKIILTENEEITFLIYNVKLLDSIKYERKINKSKIYSISNIFKTYDNIDEIFKTIIKLIEEKKFKIEAFINQIKIKLFISDMFNNSKEIEIILNKKENKDEYIKLLSK